MKKNRMMRLASAMLVMTLLTTSIISGTFAKYVTKDTGTDSARVAKWGVTVTAQGTTFATEYDAADQTLKDVNGDLILKSVVTATGADADGKKLVAPGTSGSMGGVTLGGTPEVATAVKYDATVELGDNWVYNSGAADAQDEYYCPLVITVGKTKYYGMDYASADEFENAVKNAIDAHSKNYQANTDLSKIDDGFSISWEWAYEKTENGASSKNEDAKDTYLGNQAANGNPATVELTVAVSVTQID